MPAMVARHLTIHGRVQGVFLRAETRRLAREAGVTGWIANRDDGTVEAWLEGRSDAVAGVESWLRDGGPSDADVTSVIARAVEPAGHPRFEVVG